MFDVVPLGLSSQAHAIWNWYREHLMNAAWLQPYHASMFCLMCEDEAWMQTYKIQEMQPSVLGANGSPMENPSLKSYDKVAGRWTRYWKDLGLTPILHLSYTASRAVLGGEEEPQSRVVIYLPDNGRERAGDRAA
jgi:hypothetical protein